MHAVREFPPNPQALVIHVDRRLTDQIVETYLPGSIGRWPDWVGAVLALPGVRVLSVNPYKIRLQKQKDVCWRELQLPFETVLHDRLGVQEIRDLVECETRRRRFAWHGAALARAVYEGRRQAADNPLAAGLFEIHGVAEVILDGYEIEVRKCPLCSWSDLARKIELRLTDPGSPS